jgi:hypothetical protein
MAEIRTNLKFRFGSNTGHRFFVGWVEHPVWEPDTGRNMILPVALSEA